MQFFRIKSLFILLQVICLLERLSSKGPENFLRSKESHYDSYVCDCMNTLVCVRLYMSERGCLECQMWRVRALVEKHFICLATVGCPCQGRWWRQRLCWRLVRWGHNELERAQCMEPFFGIYARDGSVVKRMAGKAGKQAGRQEGRKEEW